MNLWGDTTIPFISERRGDLQECGTRWAHENMQAVGRKEEGRFKLTLHAGVGSWRFSKRKSIDSNCVTNSWRIFWPVVGSRGL